MFGYVRAYKPELKISEYDTYKAVYCSLCRQLGKDYGVFAKFILSYDFVFLAMLKLGLENECCGYKKMRCPFNPMKKCMRLEKKSESLSFSSACLIIMFYYKLLDDFKDNGIKGKIRSGFLYPIFSHYHKKAVKRYPEIENVTATLMKKQAEVENQTSVSVDAAAEPSAKLLEFVFSYDEDGSNKRILQNLGYTAGKWVYLIDALDDLDEDLKKKSYNPFLRKYNDLDVARKNAKALINNCNVEMSKSFELLEFKRYKTILSNIIYFGLPNVLKQISDHKNKENKKWQTPMRC